MSSKCSIQVPGPRGAQAHSVRYTAGWDNAGRQAAPPTSVDSGGRSWVGSGPPEPWGGRNRSCRGAESSRARAAGGPVQLPTCAGCMPIDPEELASRGLGHTLDSLPPAAARWPRPRKLAPSLPPSLSRSPSRPMTPHRRDAAAAQQVPPQVGLKQLAVQVLWLRLRLRLLLLAAAAAPRLAAAKGGPEEEGVDALLHLVQAAQQVPHLQASK